MPALFSNNASATLSSSITTSTTSITVSTGQGALFPAVSGGNFFYATLTDSSNNLEIVKVTGRASDVLTVVRAQEGTSARAYAAADRIELRVTAAVLGNLVQLDGDQTIAGVKTFTTPIAVASGGTGTGTATGTGSVVLANSPTIASPTITSPTLTTPALGTPASGVLTNCSGTAASLTAGAAQSVTTTNWTVIESGGKLFFRHGGVNRMSLDSSGNLIVTGNVTAYGTP